MALKPIEKPNTPGPNIQSIPKKPSIDLSQGLSHPEADGTKTQTLHQYLTDNEHRPYILPFLKNLTKVVPEWKKFLAFYQQNMTGDMETFSQANKKYISETTKRLILEWEKTQLL